MVLKRPFGDEECCEHPWKQPRQLECSNQLASFGEIVSCNNVPQKPHISVGEGGLNKCQFDERLTIEGVGADKEFETSAPGGISSFSWVTSSTSEEDSKSESAVRLSFFPGFFGPDHSTRTVPEHEEIYSPVFDFPPRKLVSVGPDHQADVPVCSVQGIKNVPGSDISAISISSQESLGSDRIIEDGISDKIMGTCVIPMPDSEASFHGRNKVGEGRTDCSCQDEGSVRCVRQHIMEAKEKLIGILGQERFVELGFCDMGEEVARKWSEEEEQLFHEVVFSNPASLGKNFWDHLSVVFPSRTMKELVSYYFNVFVLRRRGEQNRLDPLNIDSDNDEWQGSEDGDDELGSTEEDEDSVVESPADQDYPIYSVNHVQHFEEDDEGGDESYANHVGNEGRAAREEDDGKLDYVSEAHTGKSPGDYSSDPVHRQNCDEDHDLQDDSCTSYECQPSRPDSCYPSITAAKQECRVESDHSKHFQSNYDGLSNMSNLAYEMEPCDAKVWDIGYISSRKMNVDLLSTCSMIEEVFGEEAWNNKGKDEKGMS